MDWDIVVESLGPRLFRYFCARFEDVIADDLTQETLIRLVEKFDRGDFDESKGTLEMWAFGMARFVRLEQLKKKSMQSLSLEEEGRIADASDMEQKVEAQSDLLLLRRGIAQLEEPQQEILLLTIDKEWSMEQIALHMDMPLGTVKSHVHRAKKNVFSFVSRFIGETHGPRV